jgi:hypothetical protein
MTKKGAAMPGSCKPVIDSCLDSIRSLNLKVETTANSIRPAINAQGKCPSASHVKLEIKEVQAINR